jgi:ATP synthase protein I
VVSLLLCIGGGILLDRWLGTSPLLTLIGVGLGLITAGYSLYELAVLGSQEHGLVKLKKPVSPEQGQAAGEDRAQSR